MPEFGRVPQYGDVTTVEYPVRLPVDPDGCPAHPFMADHDRQGCCELRVSDKVAAIRRILNSGLSDAERLWILDFLKWRYTRA